MTATAHPAQGRLRMHPAVYWTATILVALNFIFGGLSSLLGNAASKEVFVRLGYPGYFENYLAIWQLLAIVALLIPGSRVLREWAYAGLVFDTISAVYSLSAINSPTAHLLPALIVLVLVVVSYCGWRQRQLAVKL